MTYRFSLIANQPKIKMQSPNFHPTLLSIPYTIRGVRWTIHDHDKDILFPSCPHAHAEEKPWKLDIYSGKVYHAQTKKFVLKLRNKELKKIWQTPGFINIVFDERKRYEEYRKKDPVRYKPLPKIPENLLLLGRYTTDTPESIQISLSTDDYMHSSTHTTGYLCILAAVLVAPWPTLPPMLVTSGAVFM